MGGNIGGFIIRGYLMCSCTVPPLYRGYCIGGVVVDHGPRNKTKKVQIVILEMLKDWTHLTMRISNPSGIGPLQNRTILVVFVWSSNSDKKGLICRISK